MYLTVFSNKNFRNISKPPVQFVLTKLMQKVSENSLKFYQTRLDERKNLKVT